MFINFFTCAVLSISLSLVFSYNNKLFTLISYENVSESQCGIDNIPVVEVKKTVKVKAIKKNGTTPSGFSLITVDNSIGKSIDPLIALEKALHQALYGRKVEFKPNPTVNEGDADYLAHWPTGQAMRSETYQNKSSVHLPFFEFIHSGHCYLKVTKDYMQTAVDAFAILVSGSLEDVERLPSKYILDSARTIAMMRIAREKLAATWGVVKGSTPSDRITFETLEKFRPLFKYVSGREMARLNLSDEKILSYIGTHPDLTRHQVGVVASKYIELNPRWTEAKYLNMMNNLLCGVPMIFMRRIPENTYLQLTYQIFYHIRACDPLQRRFYLAMMMKTQALGKSYSWSARDVSRLGLLLADVSGPDLSAINPHAMAGIASTVMLEMPIHNLRYITEMQLRHLDPKSLNILARKLIAYQNQQLAAAGSKDRTPGSWIIILMLTNLIAWMY